MKKILRDWSWEIIVTAILGGLFALWLTSCTPSIVAPPIIKPPAAATIAPVTTVEHARVESAESEVNRLKGELETAEAKVKTARAAEIEARLAGVRMLITWLTAICVLVGILSVGAFVFLRITSLLVLTAACGAMVAAAQLSSRLLDHPAVAGVSVLVIVAGVVGVIFWKQRHTERGLVAAVSFGEAMTSAETDADAAAVKAKHALSQSLAGVRGLIDHTIQQIKQPTGT